MSWLEDQVLHITYLYESCPDQKLATVKELFGSQNDLTYVETSGMNDDYLSVPGLPSSVPVYTEDPNLGGFCELPVLGVDVDIARQFLNAPDSEATLDSLLTLVTLLYEVTDPLYAYGMLSFQAEAAATDVIARPPPVSDEGLATNEIDYPTLLMVFPPAMVDRYGQEWLGLPADDLSGKPVDRAEDLADGGLLVLATDAIADETATESDVTDRMDRLQSYYEAVFLDD